MKLKQRLTEHAEKLRGRLKERAPDVAEFLSEVEKHFGIDALDTEPMVDGAFMYPDRARSTIEVSGKQVWPPMKKG